VRCASRLQALQSQRSPLRLDLLRARRLLRVARAAHDVGEPGQLVDRRLDLVARDVESVQHLDEPVDRQRPDGFVETTHAREFRDVLHRDHLPVVGFEQPCEFREVRAVRAAHFQRIADLVDARRDLVEFLGLLFVQSV